VNDLDEQRYVNPIVVPRKEEELDFETRRVMDELRQEIHRLKVDLANGVMDFRIPIWKGSKPIVKLAADRTMNLYQNCRNVVGFEEGTVFLNLGREQLLNGRFVRAFLERVTHQEIVDFFSGNVLPLDTVIVSGRTSLWPGFEDRLKKTLGNIPNWISFSRDATVLKEVVVLGMLENQFRWRDLVVEDPGIVGDFVVLYEHKAPNDWRYHVFEKSGQTEEFYLGNSVLVKIGIRTTNGFQQCFSFKPADYYDSKDKSLKIKLIFDKSGYLEAEITSSQKQVEVFRGLDYVATLPYRGRPWPLGASKLHALEPDEVMK
jgi:hypothetical protein